MEYKCEKCELTFNTIQSKSQHIRKCNLTKEIIENIRIDYYQNNFSFNEIISKYKITRQQFNRIILKKRNLKEASVLAHKKYPQKHTEVAKEKIRIKRYEHLIKVNSEGAWKRRNERKMSYLEEWFYDNVIIKYSLEQKYDVINEYAFYPYFIDFAFLNIKLAIEMDSQYHANRVEHDKKKDQKLIDNGWKVYRIQWYDIKKDGTIEKFLDFLENIESKEPKMYGEYVLKYKEIKVEKEKSIKVKKEKVKSNLSFLRKIHYQKVYEERKQIILNSGIDFSKYGWVEKTKKLLNLSHSEIIRFMKKHMIEFYSNCYSRIKNKVPHEEVESLNIAF